MTVLIILKIFLIIFCVVGIAAVIITNGWYFKYAKKECIVEDILFCSPLVFFIVTLIMA